MPCFLLLLFLWGDPPPEAERLDTLIQELTTLKAQVAAVEGRIDVLLRGLSEQRGALQSKPPQFNALKSVEVVDSPADKKKVLTRCAAITTEGKRCSRSAVEGSRYCGQHRVAHQK